MNPSLFEGDRAKGILVAVSEDPRSLILAIAVIASGILVASAIRATLRALFGNPGNPG